MKSLIDSIYELITRETDEGPVYDLSRLDDANNQIRFLSLLADISFKAGSRNPVKTPINTGGPAFPFVQWRSPDGMYSIEQDAGMTLRDWYAGQVAPAFLTELYTASRSKGITFENIFKSASQGAFEMADTILAEREKGGAL